MAGTQQKGIKHPHGRFSIPANADIE